LNTNNKKKLVCIHLEYQQIKQPWKRAEHYQKVDLKYTEVCYYMISAET